jgi:hypothetical protein
LGHPGHFDGKQAGQAAGAGLLDRGQYIAAAGWFPKGEIGAGETVPKAFANGPLLSEGGDRDFRHGVDLVDEGGSLSRDR